MITANRVRLASLVAIATLGVYLGAPAVMRYGAEHGMSDTQRQLVLVALLELIVFAGTLTYFSTRPTHERVIGAVLVIGALSVTVTAGVAMYGVLGFIAPTAYFVTAHLTAAPHRAGSSSKQVETKISAQVVETDKEPWVGDAQEVAPRESIPPDMAAIEPPRPQPEPDAFDVEPPVEEDETLTRLRALRAQHGWQAAAKEREQLGVGWDKIRTARTILDEEAKR